MSRCETCGRITEEDFAYDCAICGHAGREHLDGECKRCLPTTLCSREDFMQSVKLSEVPQ